MCRECGGILERAFGDMRSLMHEVSVVAMRQTKVYRANGRPQTDEDRDYDPEAWLPAFLRSPHGRTALRPTVMPVNLDASALLWEAGNTLSTWARELSESKGAEIPTDWLTWITDNARSFRYSECAFEVYDEITYLHGRMIAAVDRTASRIYAGPCHALVEGAGEFTRGGRCQRDLYAKPGVDEIRCDGHRADGEGCGAVHTTDERRDWLLAAIGDALLPLTTWQQALPKMLPELKWPPRQTWWRWAETEGRHQRLFSYVDDAVGTPLYAGGHVLEVVRAQQVQLATRGGRRSA
jgi:hypothetical protein